MNSPLDLLCAGLLSHGFIEDELAPEGWRRFGGRLGRETRWLCEETLELRVGDEFEGALVIPFRYRTGPKLEWEVSDQHKLLMKCGGIYIRTRKEYPLSVPAKSPKLIVDADDLLNELGGS